MVTETMVDKTGLLRGGWYMASISILACPNLTETEKLAINGLWSFMFGQRTVAFPGIKRLVKRTAIKERSLKRALQGLRLKGMIVVKNRGRKTNLYELRTPKWFLKWVKECEVLMGENKL